jgi:hypothetical protein
MTKRSERLPPNFAPKAISAKATSYLIVELNDLITEAQHAIAFHWLLPKYGGQHPPTIDPASKVRTPCAMLLTKI